MRSIVVDVIPSDPLTLGGSRLVLDGCAIALH
jgi:hypothetical protein